MNMVDGKEEGKDMEGTTGVNLNDTHVKGAAKEPPLSHPPYEEHQNLTQNVQLSDENKSDVIKDAEKGDVMKDAEKSMDNTTEVVEGEEKDPCPSKEQTLDEKAVEMLDAECLCDNQDSVELTNDANIKANDNPMCDDVKLKSTRNGNVQVDVNGKHDEGKDAKLKFEGSDDDTDRANIDVDAKELHNAKNDNGDGHPLNEKASETKAEDDGKEEESKHGLTKLDLSPKTEIKNELAKPMSPKPMLDAGHDVDMKTPNKSFLLEPSAEGYESGTEEEQAAFRKEVETFYRENNLEFKAPKFYKEDLNLLKLWRQVIKLGGYEQVTSCKLWRQVGESFRPPKTCTTVSWTFRIFYEKALVEYEKHKMRSGELPFFDGSLTESIRVENQTGGSQALGSGRARRDAAARAMQGWHSQRLLGNGQVCYPIIKDKNLSSTPKGDKQLKTNGLLKRKKPSTMERAVHVTHMKMIKPQRDSMVVDIGPPADWVKINVQRTNDCFEIYALVPGLLREEVHVQSDPAGRLIISGQPEQLDNPWGVTPFKKVVSLPSRIDPHQTSAVVTLHGQLFVRVPFEQSDL